MLIKADSQKTRDRQFSEIRANNRRRRDIESGLTRTTGPQRGDFGLCRDLDKTLNDFKRFKNPKDRAKIESEYHGKQVEYRKNHVLGK